MSHRPRRPPRPKRPPDPSARPRPHRWPIVLVALSIVIGLTVWFFIERSQPIRAVQIVAQLEDDPQYSDWLEFIETDARLFSKAVLDLEERAEDGARKRQTRDAFRSLSEGNSGPIEALLQDLMNEEFDYDRKTQCEIALLSRHLATFRAMHDHDAAIAEFEAAIQRNSDDPDSWFGLARMHDASADPLAAEAAYLHVIDLGPVGGGKRLSVGAYRHLDRIYTASGQEQSARNARSQIQVLARALTEETRSGNSDTAPRVRREMEALGSLTQGLMHFLDGKIYRACREWRAARATYSELDDPGRVVEASGLLASSCCPT